MNLLSAKSCHMGLLLTGALLLAGCESGSPVGTNPVIPATASAAVLRSGDALTVAIQGIPDPSTHSVQIDEQGLINLPFIGAVNASGITSAELSQNIRHAYIERDFYTNVDISVTVTERFVYVGGEVARPGRILWTPDLTLTKAIQAAGGFTLYARERSVTLTRDQRTYTLNANLSQRNPEEDPLLIPGDSIQVPRSPF